MIFFWILGASLRKLSSVRGPAAFAEFVEKDRFRLSVTTLVSEVKPRRYFANTKTSKLETNMIPARMKGIPGMLIVDKPKLKRPSKITGINMLRALLTTAIAPKTSPVLDSGKNLIMAEFKQGPTNPTKLPTHMKTKNTAVEGAHARPNMDMISQATPRAAILKSIISSWVFKTLKPKYL